MLLVLALLATGCASPEPVTDQRPEFIPRSELASVMWLGNASGIILDDRHLLTNAHVWAAKHDPWWQHDPPLHRRLIVCPPIILDPDDKIGSRNVNFNKIPFELVAAGDLGIEPGPDGEPLPTRNKSGDWVLAVTDQPRWDPDNTAFIHPPARDPDWTVPEGTELYCVGFSSIFIGTSKLDPEEIARILFTGPFTLRGEAIEIEGHPAIKYPLGWPKPGGHSGGGVFLWNEEAKRLELAGVFHSYTTGKALLSVGGVFTIEMASLKEYQILYYAPIAPVLEAYESSSN